MSDLKRITELAILYVKQIDTVKDLEEKLKQAKKASLRTEREDLPMLLKEVGITEITLTDGSKVSIVDDCDCRITDATRPRALAWLIKNNFGGLIKTNLTMTFGNGEHDEAIEIRDELAKDGHPVELKEAVHPATLKSFVKEQMGKGEAIPMDLFNVFTDSKAKMKKGK